MTNAVADNQRHRWNDRMPPDRAWRSRRDATSTSRAAEQDRAAGGRAKRTVLTGEGSYARASVALRLYRRTRRVRAYLRWSESGSTNERYLGEVDSSTRAQNLRQAWKLARTTDLLTSEPVPIKSWASDSATRAIMRANRSRDTAPERRLRTELHRSGLRYRVSFRPEPDLRRTADIVFTKARVAVFVDGCFWHGCPQHHRPASKNSEYWRNKIQENQDRDAETNRFLEERGWRVIRIWEHDVGKMAAREIAEAVMGPG